MGWNLVMVFGIPSLFVKSIPDILFWWGTNHHYTTIILGYFYWLKINIYAMFYKGGWGGVFYIFYFIFFPWEKWGNERDKYDENIKKERGPQLWDMNEMGQKIKLRGGRTWTKTYKVYVFKPVLSKVRQCQQSNLTAKHKNMSTKPIHQTYPKILIIQTLKIYPA